MVEMLAATTLILLLQVATTQDPDTAGLRRQARKAESRYESLARFLAPLHRGGWTDGRCDEIVGRFCLRFDPTERDTPLPPEAPGVRAARLDAIEALRRAYAGSPAHPATAGALVRHLVSDGRAGEAVAAARTFALFTADTLGGHLLVGTALHAAGQDSASEREFAAALARMDARDVRRMQDVRLLLASEERRVYDKLDDTAREAYEGRLWRLADPLYLTPGNEAWCEHVARHVLSRLYAEAPAVPGSIRWGKDLDELTLRYGLASSREKVPGSWGVEANFVERYDPASVALVPEALATKGLPVPPPPGQPPELENHRARNGYAPAPARRLIALPHQVSRFPDGDAVALRVDALFRLDSAALAAARMDPAGSAEVALFILDTELAREREVRRQAPLGDSTLVIGFGVSLPAGRRVYSLEAWHGASRLAARARYALDLTAYPPGAPALSDLVIAEPFGAGGLPAGRDDARLRPRPELVLAGRDTLGLYAEVHGLAASGDGSTRYRVELALLQGGKRPLPLRAARRLGRWLGLVGPDQEPGLAWTDAGEAGRAARIALDLPLPGLDDGSYVFRLAVTDLATGSRSEVLREVRVGRPRPPTPR